LTNSLYLESSIYLNEFPELTMPCARPWVRYHAVHLLKGQARAGATQPARCKFYLRLH
jgi:hypothetical protein